ncbi:hypothetical protein [Colwellia sp. Arc7-D]|uniref:hypothetical protein n=1 Tax=Colwellia sp. Arc7-D TaxID=2161872 RepID=UPI000D36BD8A|nr:hypothetical protein [Colwellia sp. Arc7-D]AWB57596.1 hypothetical protein DBO93_08495 [Colwellia sp. Arc7-D]
MIFISENITNKPINELKQYLDNAIKVKGSFVKKLGVKKLKEIKTKERAIAIPAEIFAIAISQRINFPKIV